MIIHDKVYTAFLIVRLFKEKKVTEMDIFKIEEELYKLDIPYDNITLGLTLLSAIGIIESEGINIFKMKDLTDDHILGLGKLILNL